MEDRTEGIGYSFLTARPCSPRLRNLAMSHSCSPRSCSVLPLWFVMLIEQRPKALAKDHLLNCLWPGTFVTENNLATVIVELRSALRDDAHRPRFIRTVYGYGYAFDCEASEERVDGTDGCGWRLIHEHREIALRPGTNILGRAGPDVVVIDASTVSRHHARLSIDGDQALVQDLGSKNGTWVGRAPAGEPIALSDGDELRLGSVVLTVRFARRAVTTETVERAAD